jgi:bis(5'-nucleosyl)-tetraphosphatase (symmetrical)
MTCYAIGDVQGCHDALRGLLDRLKFDPAADRLLFAGDLVNRGPDSLAVLRFVRSLGAAAVTVLGNHDLHLLARARGARAKSRDTLEDVLAAPDCDELLAWLQSRPLAWGDDDGRWLLVHAGLPPQWTRAQALSLAAEVSAALQGGDSAALFSEMYGDLPDLWDEALAGAARQRFIINCLTRMRFVGADGRIDLRHKAAPGTQPAGLVPWFDAPGRRSAGDTILFGHWSALGQVHWPAQRVYGLDCGCIWGGSLCALNLDSGAVTRQRCRAP